MKEFTIRVDEKGTLRVTNNGFNPFEIVGFCEVLRTQTICTFGKLKPDQTEEIKKQDESH